MTTMSNAIVMEHKDPTGARIGMWLFLFTELLLFGGLFLLYAVYRSQFPEDFAFAAGNLDSFMGTLNTVILLTSSLSMALAVGATARGKRLLAGSLLSLTIVAGIAFLVNKYFEWSAKFHHGLYPNSEELLRHTPGENVFYGLYYAMTGLHGLHVIIGLLVLVVMLYFVWRTPKMVHKVVVPDSGPLKVTDGDGNVLHTQELDHSPASARLVMLYDNHPEVTETLETRVENAGLYWHLVDVIWIFLFPLFYLIS
jgi:cytochrome c oxidase subunit III